MFMYFLVMVFLLWSILLRKLFFKELCNQNIHWYLVDKICVTFFVWICPQNILILAWETYSEKFTCFAYRKGSMHKNDPHSSVLLLSYKKVSWGHYAWVAPINRSSFYEVWSYFLGDILAWWWSHNNNANGSNSQIVPRSLFRNKRFALNLML